MKLPAKGRTIECRTSLETFDERGTHPTPFKPAKVVERRRDHFFVEIDGSRTKFTADGRFFWRYPETVKRRKKARKSRAGESAVILENVHIRAAMKLLEDALDMNKTSLSGGYANTKKALAELRRAGAE